MISFEEKDFNLGRVFEHTNLLELRTDPDYQVFGLKKGAERPCIEIQYNYNLFPLLYDITYYLQAFFRNNGISFRINPSPDYVEKTPNLVKIGLRHDVREHIEFSARIMETIIYACEKKFQLKDVDMRKRISLAPKFEA